MVDMSEKARRIVAGADEAVTGEQADEIVVTCRDNSSVFDVKARHGEKTDCYTNFYVVRNEWLVTPVDSEGRDHYGQKVV